MSDIDQINWGKALYAGLYPPDPKRFPNGRFPWRALKRQDKERYEGVAEGIANEAAVLGGIQALQYFRALVSDHIPVIDYGPIDLDANRVLDVIDALIDDMQETQELPEVQS